LSKSVTVIPLIEPVGYVSQLERGAKRPSGPALILLDVIRRKGIEAIPRGRREQGCLTADWTTPSHFRGAKRPWR
jgi:hypothetical protein